MLKILYISMCIPFDQAFHAGGKTFNYYINRFANNENNDVTLIAKILPDEENFISSINPRIHLHLVSMPKSGIKRATAYLKSVNSKINPWYPYGNTLTKEIYDQIEKELRNLRLTGYEPDIVILEWTEMLLFIDAVKKYFPSAKYVASEHDVSFLGKQRRAESESRFIQRRIKTARYKNIKQRELSAIEKCDLVVTHNDKDRKLLIANNVDSEKLDVIAPFYAPFQEIQQKDGARDIIFYGAMNRLENYSAALWFIDNVLPMIEDLDVRFVIVGNKPPKELVERQNEKIIVTGFVENVESYFSEALCLVAPLLYGAGIKVKVLEALTAGLVTLTNDIGIEGIDATNGREYIHCTLAADYEKAIRGLLSGEICKSEISSNAKRLIKSHYDLDKSFENYSNRIKSLLKHQ